MTISKKHIATFFLVIYGIFSISYIGYDLWSEFKEYHIKRSFNEGQRMTVEQLISQAEQPECQPFSVFNEEKQVQLINISCLQAQQEKPIVSQTIEEIKNQS